MQELPNSPKSYEIFKQFCEIATAAGGLAMTKSDFFDGLKSHDLQKQAVAFLCYFTMFCA